MIPVSVEACTGCIYFDDKDNTNMIANNICHKRASGACSSAHMAEVTPKGETQ